MRTIKRDDRSLDGRTRIVAAWSKYWIGNRRTRSLRPRGRRNRGRRADRCHGACFSGTCGARRTGSSTSLSTMKMSRHSNVAPLPREDEMETKAEWVTLPIPASEVAPTGDIRDSRKSVRLGVVRARQQQRPAQPAQSGRGGSIPRRWHGDAAVRSAHSA